MTPSSQDADGLTERVDRVVVSQAVAGEAVGLEHYARMVALATDLDDKLDLVDEAAKERAHLLAMRRAAERAGVTVADGGPDPYWSRVREAFDERAADGDLATCSVIQDVVLECYAVVLYEAIAPIASPEIGRVAARIANDERDHLAHGVRRLAEAAGQDLDGTKARVELANERVARVLAGWVAPEDCSPVCAVCGAIDGICAKEDLRTAGLATARLRPAFVQLYGRSLRDAGLPAADVTRWLARLL